jgi:hypothetical protein
MKQRMLYNTMTQIHGYVRLFEGVEPLGGGGGVTLLCLAVPILNNFLHHDTNVQDYVFYQHLILP